MIVPVFKGIDSPSRIPVTWSLVFINLFIFGYTTFTGAFASRDLELLVSDDGFIKTQGFIYAKYVLDRRENYSSLIQFKAREALAGDEESVKLLGGQLALQDGVFSEEILTTDIGGDEVRIEMWRERFAALNKSRSSNPVFTLGINYFQKSLNYFITYQFSHSGALHLVFNMLFLLIFGTLLEPLLGGLIVLIAYLLGGIFAGYGFLFYSGLSVIPLVGSSGSVSVLIGLTVGLLFDKKARFFYPMGFIRLPVWSWALYFWLLLDIAGLVKEVPGFPSQVAHSAHISGTLIGLVVGGLLRGTSNYFDSKVQRAGDELLVSSR